MSFVYWVFKMSTALVSPHNSGYVGVSEDRRNVGITCAPLKKHRRGQNLWSCTKVRGRNVWKANINCGQICASAGILYAVVRLQNQGPVVDDHSDLYSIL